MTAGANVTFSVVATASQPLTYVWSFAGTALAGATNSTLLLTDVQPTNSGIYSVKVSDSAGSTSASAVLTVNAAASGPTITAEPQSLTVTNGANAAFSVTASGTAPLSYQWLQNGAPIATATDSAYSLISVTTNQAGAYTVVVSNSSSSATSTVATLTVLVPAWIATQPQGLTVASGADATFTVVAGGVPAPTYLWQFNGTNLAGASSPSLTITNVQTAEAGDYTVVVSNSVGSIISSSAHLALQVASAPLSLSTPRLANGGFAFDVAGPGQTNYVIWISADLATWTAYQTNFSANGTLHWIDTNSHAGAAFYRASLGQ